MAGYAETRSLELATLNPAAFTASLHPLGGDRSLSTQAVRRATFLASTLSSLSSRSARDLLAVARTIMEQVIVSVSTRATPTKAVRLLHDSGIGRRLGNEVYTSGAIRLASAKTTSRSEPASLDRKLWSLSRNFASVPPSSAASSSRLGRGVRYCVGGGPSPR